MTPKTLLVELFTEELPPKSLKRLGESFAELLHTGLANRGLVALHASVTRHATPRRLAAQITHVLAVASDREVEHKLMPVSVGLDPQGAASPALKKKLAALGARDVDVSALERRARRQVDAAGMAHDTTRRHAGAGPSGRTR